MTGKELPEEVKGKDLQGLTLFTFQHTHEDTILNYLLAGAGHHC